MRSLAAELSFPEQIKQLAVPEISSERIGKKRIPQLEESFDDVEELASASEDEIYEAFLANKVVAENVHAFLNSQGGRRIIDDLKEAGVSMKSSRPTAGAGDAAPLKGKTVVVTGTLEYFNRNGAEDAVKAAGGRPTSSVSKKTDFVVVGGTPGSKADKAQKLGVEIIDEEEFIRRLGKRPEELIQQ